MSIEKSLYTRTVVPEARTTTAPPLSKTYRGISTVGNPTGGFALYDLALIKQDIVNYFHIRYGERLENPNFGTIIWDLLFEPLTAEVKNLIVQNVSTIINSDPRVRVQNVIVSEYESGIQIECELTYLIYNISENLRFKFDKDNSLLG
jgi:phage baseplate assembly protein W